MNKKLLLLLLGLVSENLDILRHPLWSRYLSRVCAQGPPASTPAWAVQVLQNSLVSQKTPWGGASVSRTTQS